MWLEIINAICWGILFICLYFILNPEIKIIKNVQPSPYKKYKKKKMTDIIF